jgi:hypothetical protein
MGFGKHDQPECAKGAAEAGPGHVEDQRVTLSGVRADEGFEVVGGLDLRRQLPKTRATPMERDGGGGAAVDCD